MKRVNLYSRYLGDVLEVELSSGETRPKQKQCNREDLHVMSLLSSWDHDLKSCSQEIAQMVGESHANLPGDPWEALPGFVLDEASRDVYLKKCSAHCMKDLRTLTMRTEIRGCLIGSIHRTCLGYVLWGVSASLDA